MKKSALRMVALVLSALLVPLAASAKDIKGSDTLYDVMTQALTTWGGGTLTYVGGGSGTAESAMTAGTQYIGPMSRNFKQAVLDQHATWAPDACNVLGLDGVVIVGNTSSAQPNITDTSLLQKALGGVGGTGTVKDCAAPARIQAIKTLMTTFGVTALDHFYRRDDSSGTTDTMKEKLGIARFCNGAATGTGNEDRDPVRTVCVVTNPATCTSGSTQGFVVPLSQPASGCPDVTTTIGHYASTFYALGYAGLEAKTSRTGSCSVSDAYAEINSVTPSVTTVRDGSYALSRRLFLMFNPDAPSGDEVNFRYWFTNGCADRSRIDPILTSFGFVTCGNSTLCSSTPFPAAAASAPACTANGSIPATGGACCSGVADSSGVCVAYTGRANGVACETTSDCASNHCRQDGAYAWKVCTLL